MILPQIFDRSSDHAGQHALPPAGGSVDPRTVSPMLTGGRVHRAVVFDLETFDALKAWQRAIESEAGVSIGNSEVLRMLILAHHVPNVPRGAE